MIMIVLGVMGCLGVSMMRLAVPGMYIIMAHVMIKFLSVVLCGEDRTGK